MTRLNTYLVAALVLGLALVFSARATASGKGGGTKETRIEGRIVAVDAAGGIVKIRRQNGTIVVIRVTAATKIERNDRHVRLSAFKVGDRGEARISPSGVTTKIEAVGP